MLICAYCARRRLPPLDFAHAVVGRWERGNEEMTEQLESCLNHLYACHPEPSRIARALVSQLQKTVHHLSVDLSQAQLPAFYAWLEQARGVAFLEDGSVRGVGGQLLAHPSKPADAGALLALSSTALQRKAASQRRLTHEKLPVCEDLPTVVDEEEVRLRLPEEVARRALALFVVALRAESLALDDPLSAADLQEQQPVGFAALSPVEFAYLTEPSPPVQSSVEMSWRYEALQLLLWALGRAELPPATASCQASRLAGQMLQTDEHHLVATANLRYTGVLLDTLDLHYRYHHVVREAAAGGAASLQLIPGVVYERNHALFWLTCFEEAPWDEVGIPA